MTPTNQLTKPIKQGEGRQTLFKRESLLNKLSSSVADKIWGDLVHLKAQLDTGDNQARPENVTTSMYLTGNQILFGLTKNGLCQMVKRSIYEAIAEADIEKHILEKELDKAENLNRSLKFRLKNTSVKSLMKERDRLARGMSEIKTVLETAGFLMEENNRD